MNGFLKWLRGWHAPQFVTTPPAPRVALAPRPHIVHAPHLDECECGRAHPAGWICAAAIGGRS